MESNPPEPARPLSILVVDDEANIRRTLSLCLATDGHQVVSVSTAADALAEAAGRVVDLAFVDLRLGQDSGLDLIPGLHAAAPWVKIVVITAYASIDSAVEAMRRGAFDYLPKPFTPDEIRMATRKVAQVRALEQRVETLEGDLKAAGAEMTLDTASPAMQRTLELARQLARTEATVLLRGESGTGKSYLARAVHAWSGRAERPLAVLSCPTLSAELLESELFGHVRGAFTGAVRDNPGRIARVEGGTLVLDEIGDLPLSIQPKLLRFLQDREYERVGDPVTRRADVRLIAATHVDLEAAVAAGRFREDLFYRLNVVPLTVPPLRDRPEDIPLLAAHLLAFFGQTHHRLLYGFTPPALEALQAHPWPGNVRENYRSIVAAHTMEAALERQEGAVLLGILGNREQSLHERQEAEADFLSSLGVARGNITIPGEEQVVESIGEKYRAYRTAVSRADALPRQEHATALAAYQADIRPAAQAVRAACQQLRQVNQATMYAASQRAGQVTQWAIGSTLAVGLAAVAVGLVFSLLLTRRLVRPLERMIATAQRIGEGQYDVRVPADGGDELGRLADEFNHMARRLLDYHNLNLDQLVAEQRKSEAILRSIEDGLIVVDPELRVTDANPTALRQLGCDLLSVEGRPLAQCLPDPPLLEQVRQVGRTGEAVALDAPESILTLERPEGTRHLMVSATPVRPRGEGLPGVVLLLRDVTRLKEVDRLKTQFVMTASHELRTPLTSIGMSIALLREGAMDRLDETQRQLLLAAHEEVQRLKALVADLLDLSRI
ncbi:MAG: sigma 54-interacting transcriptional regulator [Candidatus Latescibacterota bacterium]